MSDDLKIRNIETGDTETIASAFQAIGWNKSENLYRTYLKEQVEGTRVVLVAFYEGNFVVYGNVVIWTSTQ